MPRLTYSWAFDVKDLALRVLERCSDVLGSLDLNRIYFVRSYGSRTTAVARVHVLPPVWRFTLNLRPLYAVEVVSERFDSLPLSEKLDVVVHELLHIPPRMGGGLRPHNEQFYRLLARVRRCIRGW